VTFAAVDLCPGIWALDVVDQYPEAHGMNDIAEDAGHR